MNTTPPNVAEVCAIVAAKQYDLNFTTDVPDELKSDPEVIACILENCSLDFTKLPEQAQNDPAILRMVVKEAPFEYENFPEWARDDRDLTLAAVTETADAFKYASERLRGDRDVVSAALSARPSYDTIAFVSDSSLLDDVAIILQAVQGHNQAYAHIPEQWRADPAVLDAVIAMDIDASSFQLFPDAYRDNDEIALKAVTDDGSSYEYVSARLRADRTFALRAMTANGDALRYLPEEMKDDKEVVLAGLKAGDGLQVSGISDRLKSDVDVALTAVKSDNRALQYLTPERRNDERVINACLDGTGAAYEYFGDRFKSDIAIATTMAGKWGFSLEHAPDIIRNTRNIVRRAVETDANNYKFIGDGLKEDMDFLRELHAVNERILYHVDDDIKNRLFVTRIKTEEHRGTVLELALTLEDSFVDGNQRLALGSVVTRAGTPLVELSRFPVLVYEDDGPIGSYLTARSTNGLMIVGDFLFFVRRNTGAETWSNHLAGEKFAPGWGPEAQTTTDFLNHEVYLVPETIAHLDYASIPSLPRIYFGSEDNIPRGVQAIATEDHYREALTALEQKKNHGKSHYVRVDDHTLRVKSSPADEIFGAARVFVDGHGWRFLIPHDGGAMKSLERLRQTDDNDDKAWIRQQTGEVTAYQRELLRRHFGDDVLG